MAGIKRGMKPVHPGIMFKEEVLDELPRMTVSLAAKALGVSRAHLGEVTKGKARISPELAFKIGLATNTSAEMWLSLQDRYDLWEIEQDHSIRESVQAAALCA